MRTRIDAREFSLPARPAVLAELSAEMAAEHPDVRKVSALVNKDLGLAAAVVRTANSPYFGVCGRIGSVQQALSYLGVSQVHSLVAGVMLRRAFPERDPLVEAVWDVSARRGALMARLARNAASVPVDMAYTAGLFQDCGAMLMAELVDGYRQAWSRTRWLPQAAEIETQDFGIDHATLGAMLVESWGLALEIAIAVKSHHAIRNASTQRLDARSRSLIALAVLADYVLVRALGPDHEIWEEEFGIATTLLEVPPMTSHTWVDQAGALLATSH